MSDLGDLGKADQVLLLTLAVVLTAWGLFSLWLHYGW